jgi:hypothetical protein
MNSGDFGGVFNSLKKGNFTKGKTGSNPPKRSQKYVWNEDYGATAVSVQMAESLSPDGG